MLNKITFSEKSKLEYIGELAFSYSTVKEIVIPEEFSDVYMKYNGLQRSAGYDLMPYRGRKATVYTYRVTDAEDTVINLIVSDGKIIGGDISSVRIDGEMKPLIPV